MIAKHINYQLLVLFMTLSYKVIERIFKLRDTGYTIREIAKKLGIAKSTVERYLKKGRMVTIAPSATVRKELSPVVEYEEDSTIYELDKIISEVTNRHGRAAVIRMVHPYIHDPNCRDYGLSKLGEALTIANFSPRDRQLILINWAQFVGLYNTEL